MMCWHRYYTWMCLLVWALVVPIGVAADVSVRPLLVDRVIEPRSLLTESITVTNTTQNKLTIYATVNEVSLDEGGEIKDFVPPGASDRTVSVTSWLEITRGRIELQPGETVTVPLTIAVHHDAKPGRYHAFVGFVYASKRYEAEAIALSGKASGVIVRLELADQRREGLRISRFVVDRFVSGLNAHVAEITVENFGEVPATPTGEIIFYNSRGQEIAEIPLAGSVASLAPGERKLLQYPIPDGFSLGRHKANIRLQYGSQQLAQLTDTTFFLVIPWKIVVLFLAIVLTLVIVLLLWWRRHIGHDSVSDEIDDVRLFVNSGVSRNPADHDINLKS